MTSLRTSHLDGPNFAGANLVTFCTNRFATKQDVLIVQTLFCSASCRKTNRRISRDSARHTHTHTHTHPRARARARPRPRTRTRTRVRAHTQRARLAPTHRLPTPQIGSLHPSTCNNPATSPRVSDSSSSSSSSSFPSSQAGENFKIRRNATKHLSSTLYHLTPRPWLG